MSLSIFFFRNVSHHFCHFICLQPRSALHWHDGSSRRNSLDFGPLLRNLLRPFHHRWICLVIHDLCQPYLYGDIVRHGQNIRDVFHADNGCRNSMHRIRCFCLPHDWISPRPETDSKLMSCSPTLVSNQLTLDPYYNRFVNNTKKRKNKKKEKNNTIR